jgi:hypothetical protein
MRQRYCSLYERQFRLSSSVNPTKMSMTGEVEPNIPTSTLTNQDKDECVAVLVQQQQQQQQQQEEEGVILTLLEQNELSDMEDGITGGLSAMDIILYRMIVQRRVASSSNRGAGREKVHSTTTTTKKHRRRKRCGRDTMDTTEITKFRR